MSNSLAGRLAQTTTRMERGNSAGACAVFFSGKNGLTEVKRQAKLPTNRQSTERIGGGEVGFIKQILDTGLHLPALIEINLET